MTGLTAVVPCFNEEDQIERTYRAIVDALGGLDLEILIVDDGSTDETLATVKKLATRDDRVHYLSFSRNFGIEAVHAAAFRYAAKPWTVQLDADLQSPPAETFRLLEKAADGYDVVFGIRTHRHDPTLRRWGSSGMHWAARRIFGITVPRDASTFRVMRTPVARRLAELGLGSPYFIAMVPLIGARYACVPTEHRQRDGGSKWRWARLVGHAFELFFGYSWRPLNGLYLLAALAVPVTVALGVLTLAGVLSTGAALAATLLLGATTLGAVAVVARYLYRLSLDQRRPRPYYVREANIALRPEDALDGGEPAVPPPARRTATGATGSAGSARRPVVPAVAPEPAAAQPVTS